MSTKVEWRGKGLASILLRALEKLMISKSFFVSSLHTSSVSFYSKFGYKLIPMAYVSSAVRSLSAKSSTTTNIEIQPILKITPDWIELHTQKCLHGSYHGLLIRSDSYWKVRMPQEVHRLCGRKLNLKAFSESPLDHELPFSPYCGFQFTDKIDSSKRAVFLSAQYPDQGPLVKIRELLVSTKLLEDKSLLSEVLETMLNASVEPSWTDYRLLCPGPIWNEIFDVVLPPSNSFVGLEFGETSIDDSDGIMYKSLVPGFNGLEDITVENHVFLSLDAF